MDDWRDHRFFWIAAITLLLLTRIPAAVQYLSIDNVNLAFSLENFDPRIHQPQPPGYPFFVGFARVINLVFRDAEKTFLFISVLISALCLPVLFALGKRMFSTWVGTAAVGLLLFNAVFWHSGLDGPLRPNLALFSLLTAYCSWRCWNGEKKYLYWGAAAVGVGSGFRPDLLVFLFPVWAVSAWKGTHSLKAIVQGLAVIAGAVLIWIGALVFGVGGVNELWRLTAEYLVDQSKVESVVMGAAGSSWLHQVGRLVIWNATAVVTWIWAVPAVPRSKDDNKLFRSSGLFILIWLVPGLAVQALIHVAAPGHTLFSIPPLCLLGAYFLFSAGRSTHGRQVMLSAAVALNVMIFLNFFPAPAPERKVRGFWNSAKNAVAVGTFESSIGQTRWMDDIARVALREIKDFSLADRPTVIVSNDVHAEQWFMNWRIARYYVPNLDIWVVADQKKPAFAQHVRRDKTIEARSGPVVTIPVPRGGRILWLLERNGGFHKALAQAFPLSGGAQMFWTDVPANAAPFRVLDFEFAPADLVAARTSQ